MRTLTDVDSFLLYYIKYYKQYYNGDLNFYQFVLDSIFNDYLVDKKNESLSLYDLQFSLKLIVAILLYKSLLDRKEKS